MGQGAMFIAHTYLIYKQELSYVAVLGIGLGFLSLLQWLSDGGGVFLLSKQYSDKDFGEKLISFIVARLVVGLLFYFLIFFALKYFEFSEAIISIVSLGYAVVIIWSLNLTGVLDRLNKNKFAGPLAGLSWLFSAIASLVFIEDSRIGFIVALSYALGLLITVSIHWYYVMTGFVEIDFSNLRGLDVLEQFKKIISFNAAYASTQSYARILPAIVEKALGSELSGVLVYAKNVANIVSQTIYASRRSEFGNLIDTKNLPRLGYHEIFKRQRYSFFVSLFSMILVIMSALLLRVAEVDEYYVQIMDVVCIMVLLVFIWFFSSAIGQVLVAVDKVSEYAISVVLSISLAFVVIWVCIDFLGLYAVFIAEVVMYFSGCLMFLMYLREHRKGIGVHD